jgi:ATP-binding cassette subfamily B protein
MFAVYETDEVTHAPGARPAVLRRLLVLFRPHGPTLALAALLLTATTAAQLGGPLLIRRAIDVDIRGKSVRGLLTTVACYVMVQVAFLFLNYIQKVRLETMGQEIILGLRRRLFSRLLAQSLSFYDKNPVGRLISRLQSDTDALRQMFASTIVTVLEAVVLFVGMLAVMATVSLRLTLIVAAIVPPMVAVAWIVASGGAKRFRVVRRLSADISAFIAERVQGVSILQAYNREQDSVGEMEALNRAKFRAGLFAEIFGIGMFQGIFYFEIIGLVLVLWFGGSWAITGAISLGTLFMFIEYIRRLFEPVMRLSEQLDVMQRAVAAAGLVFGLFDLEPSVTDPIEARRWDHFEREIEFKDVSFSYAGNDEYALRDVSFTIPRGERWAIVGATGGGKSSILNLLLRFYDPQQGTVLLDGIDARSISQKDLRRRMALVLQDVYLFPGDLLSNLAPDGVCEDRTTEQRLEAAARVVGADRFIERLPHGYRTPIAERGANLSAGERQILSFARALAADPEILLLDEATASIDPLTEAGIQQAMKELLIGRTAIVIAHRLSTVRDADGILVVQGGRIVERGRHEDLLAMEGVYADLHALQFQPHPGVGGGT